MSGSYNDRENPYSYFRISLDFGMGILYVVIGFIVIYTRQFGTIELSPAIVYGMSGVLFLYGIFRIYRAFIELKRRRLQKD